MITSRLVRPLLLGAAIAMSAGCRDGNPIATGVNVPGGARATISDAAHAANPYFRWLPPMMAAPDSVVNSFDPTLKPTVRVCELEAGRCRQIVAEFAFGNGTDAVRVATADEHYLVNWHTRRYTLDPAKNYRISVSARDPKKDVATTPEVQLGYADVDLLTNSRESVAVDTARYVPLVNGTTLAIKFRIEVGALTWTPVSTVLDPTRVNLHVNPRDGVMITQPTDKGEILQLFAERDAEGIPSRAVGWARFDPNVRGAKDVAVLGDNGLPRQVTLRDGTTVTFEYLDGGKVEMVWRLPDGVMQRIPFTLPAQLASRTAPLSASRSLMTVQTPSASVASASAAGVPDPVIQVKVSGVYNEYSTPVSNATVTADWEMRNTNSAGAGVQWGTQLLKETSARGTYTDVLPYNAATSLEDRVRKTCDVADAIIGPICGVVDLFVDPMLAACVAGTLFPTPVSPIIAARCASVALFLKSVCYIEASCDILPWLLDRNFVIADNRLDVTVRVSGLEISARDSAQSYRPQFPNLMFFEFKYPPSVDLRWNPEHPVTGGEYRLTARVLPGGIPGVPVFLAARGSDKFGRGQWGKTDTTGNYTVTLPAPEAAVGPVYESLEAYVDLAVQTTSYFQFR